VFALMKATGRSEAEILSWPIERRDTYVELLNDDDDVLLAVLKKLLSR